MARTRLRLGDGRVTAAAAKLRPNITRAPSQRPLTSDSLGVLPRLVPFVG
jgi:hypothetical protein